MMRLTSSLTGARALRRLAASAAFLALAAAASPAAAIDVKVVTSQGGLKAWLVEDHNNPIITVRIVWRAGSAWDPAKKFGTAQMVSELLTEGAGDLDAKAFQRALEDRSITLDFSAGRERFGATLVTLTRHKGQAFRLLRLALTQPRFDKDALERQRTYMISNAVRRTKSPRWLAGRAWRKMVFPGHPYSNPAAGTPESIKAIAREDLLAWLKANITRGNIYIGVVGDIAPGELAEVLDRVFGDLPAKAEQKVIPPIKPNLKGGVTVVRFPISQSRILFGQPGIARLHKDFITAYVMNHILGSGSVSRLYLEVREKRGLVYGIWSSLSPSDKSATYVGVAATRNQDAAKTISIIRDEWKRMAEKGVTAAELEAAKKYLTGSYARRFSSSRGIAGLLVARQIQNFKPTYFNTRNALIRAVTLEDVNRVAKELMKPGQLTFVIVGQPAGKL